jgi:hypothetical protein
VDVSEELAERVERGAALLDERRPGWWDEVDVEALDLDLCSRCPLGQLWGDFESGAYRLFRGGFHEVADMAGHHGFDAVCDNHFPILTDLWRAAIERRRAQAPA